MNQKKVLPPGQMLTEKFPILHEGPVPNYDLNQWTFKIFGAVEQEITLSWQQFSNLPMNTMVNDIHCVTTWSRYDNRWEGVYLEDIMNVVKVDPRATHIMVYGFLNEPMVYSANMPLAQVLGHKSMFALKHDGKDITPKHGYPVRFVCPESLYFWKSAKWAEGIEFMIGDRRGYWEMRGYHNEADPFKEQRFSADEAKPSGYFGVDEWANQSGDDE